MGTYREQPDPSPCMILKVIYTEVGWVWLARAVVDQQLSKDLSMTYIPDEGIFI